MKTEIVVVGAGPAGSICAGILSQLGHEVILLDRAEFPRDKGCGDGVSPMGIQIIDELGLLPEFEQLQFTPIGSCRLTYDFSFSVDFRGKFNYLGYIAPRKQFDEFLFNYAIRSGARYICADVNNLIKTDDRIHGVEIYHNQQAETIEAKFVVIANGSNSTLARSLNEKRPLPIAYALRAYIENLTTDPHCVEMFYDKRIPRGYAWLFPVNDHIANIGIGALIEHNRSTSINVKAIFNDFVKLCIARSPIPEAVTVGPVKGGMLNLGFQKDYKRVFDGALIAGDAGRLVSPLFGSGITSAMLSGRYAAETIHDVVNRSATSFDDLFQYEVRLRKALQREHRFAKIIRDILLFRPTQKIIFKSTYLAKFSIELAKRIHPDIVDIEIDPVKLHVSPKS